MAKRMHAKPTTRPTRTARRPRQPTDLTLRNLHALHSAHATLVDTVDDLKGRVAVLEAFMEERIRQEADAAVEPESPTAGQA